MTRYYLVKIDGDLSTFEVTVALKEALDAEDTHRHVRRAIIADVNNGDLTDIIDRADLMSTETATIDNGGTQ